MPEDIVVEREVATDWLVGSDGPFVAAFDPRLIARAARRGYRAGSVNRVQRLRKEAGYAYTDRIALWVSGDDLVLARFRTTRISSRVKRSPGARVRVALRRPTSSRTVDIDGHGVVVGVQRCGRPAPCRPQTLGHGMNKKQLSHLEKRLMEERARVMKELGYYDESFNATLAILGR